MANEASVAQDDFCSFNCKNHQSSRRNNEECGANLLFEVVKDELPVTPDLEKLVKYSPHCNS